MVMKVKGCSRASLKYVDIQSLCRILKIAFFDTGSNKKKQSVTSKKSVSAVTSVSPSPQSKKVCTDRPSALYPNRYTKAELVELGKRKLKLSSSRLERMSIKDLCTSLGMPCITIPTGAPDGNKKKKFDTKMIIRLPGSDASISEGDCETRSKTKLLPHQLKVVNHLKTHRGLIAYHKLGSGKTLTAVAASQCYLDANPMNTVLVIAPAGLINNFKKEMIETYTKIRLSDRYRFMSYEKFLLECKNNRLDCKNTMLIIDEAHRLRNPPSKRKVNGVVKMSGKTTTCALRCARDCDKILLLTGTPIYNNPNDIFILYNLITGKTDVSPKAKEQFHINRLKCNISVFAQEKDDVNFPKRINHTVMLPMSKEFEKQYDMVISTIDGNPDVDAATFVESIFGDADLEPFFNGLRRAVNRLELGNSEKIKWVLDFIRSHKDQKTLIFSNFLDFGNRSIIRQIPTNLKIGIIDGSVPMEERKQIVNRYNESKITTLFISRAGGEGLNLIGTNNVILFEPSWNESSEDQAIGRAIRFKSHNHLPIPKRRVDVYRLLHVRPTDNTTFQKIKQYIKKVDEGESLKTLDFPLDPKKQSLDLFLSVKKRIKQDKIKKSLDKLRELSIENNHCP